MEKYEILMDIAIRRNFLIPSCEIYGSPAGFYDYGPVGYAIKRKLENLWRLEMLEKEGFHEIESSLILPQIVLQASGHAENFVDPIVTCLSCKSKFRADHLIENFLSKQAHNIAGVSAEKLSELIKTLKVSCPSCNQTNFSEVSWFNMMFKTNIGPIEGNTAYVRPETAQGIFLDYFRIIKNYSGKLPIGIGQVGKSARNEISPRQGLIRLREFTQMELEYFFNPKEPFYPKFEKVKDEKLFFIDEQENKKYLTLQQAIDQKIIPNQIMAYFLYKQNLIYLKAGIPKEKILFRKLPKEQSPHYSLGNIDMEIETSFGIIETAGTAYRSDYDLKRHSSYSKTDLSVYDEKTGEKVIAHVIEPSMGVDRFFWVVLEYNFKDKGEGKDWSWFSFPPSIAPYHAWVFPLMKKDGLDKKAKEVEEKLREEGLSVYYQDTGSIGKRYARADEIGVPYCITIDYETLEKNDVTVRFRNDGKQIRIKIENLANQLKDYIKNEKVTLE